MMRRLDCANRRQAGQAGSVDCGRVLVSVPDAILTLLQALEGQHDSKILVRCPSCPGETRFASIGYTDKKLTFEVLDMKPDMGKKVEYENVIIAAEYGGHDDAEK